VRPDTARGAVVCLCSAGIVFTIFTAFRIFLFFHDFSRNPWQCCTEPSLGNTDVMQQIFAAYRSTADNVTVVMIKVLRHAGLHVPTPRNVSDKIR
jgi:hypothetical protein